MNTVEMNMKLWKRTLAIGVIIALASQLYWNVFVNNFRISTSVILLPVLIMTVGIQVHTRTICFCNGLHYLYIPSGYTAVPGNAAGNRPDSGTPGSAVLYLLRTHF